MTQDEVAEAIGSNRVVVGRWEADGAVPRTRTLERLAELYGVPVAELRDLVPTRPSASSDDEAPLTAEEQVRHALGLLDHVRRTLAGVLGSGVLGASPSRAAASLTRDADTPEGQDAARQLAALLDDAGIPVPDHLRPRPATGRAARRS